MSFIPPPDPAASHTAAATGPAVARLARRAILGTTLRWLAAAVLMASGLALAAWLVLQWAILPRIEYWRPQLEAQAGAALGVRVRIGTIRVDPEHAGARFGGAIELRDVVLSEVEPHPAEPGAPPREALRLPLVRAALSLGSLLPRWDGSWQLQFAQLVVDGPRLAVRRDASGRIHVAGVALAESGGAQPGGGADWFFSQPELVVRAGTLSWQDELRGGAQHQFGDVELVLRNSSLQHEFRLAATPPPSWGERFTAIGQFRQPLLASAAARQAGSVLARPGDWRRWRGTLYAESASIDLAALAAQLPLPTLAASRGHGALRTWVDLEDGRWTAITADLALADVALPSSPVSPALALAHIDGRLALRSSTLAATGRGVVTPGFADAARTTPGGELELRQLSFATADGLDWPAGDASLRWRLDADGALVGGELRAPRLDLALLAKLAARLPEPWLEPGLRERLLSLAPEGIASAVEGRFEGPLRDPLRYLLKAQLHGLAIAALAAPPSAAASEGEPPTPPLGQPGLRGADVSFEATEAGGEARMALHGGTLDFPGVFEQPRVPIERLDSRLSWRIGAASQGGATQLEVRARDTRLANADAQATFEATWTSGAVAADGSASALGTLELSGRLDDADATRVARYLPLALGAPVRRYVQDAVQAGKASRVDFKVKGELQHFPFAKQPGEFRIAALVEGVQFAYLPGPAPGEDKGTGEAERAWPVLADVSGELVFDKQSMVLRNAQGRLPSVGSGGFKLARVRGGIKNLAERAVLNLEGVGSGRLDDALRFVNATPVGGWIDGALAQASAAGANQAPIELQLGLDIPLDDAGRATRVRGQLLLAGNDLRLGPDLPLLGNAKARIGFGENAFTLEAGSARVLGGDAAVNGARDADGTLRLNVEGSASAQGLRNTPELGALARAASRLGGQTNYRLAVGFVRGDAQWLLSSNLVGLSVDLPAPLGKAALESLPLTVEASLLPRASAAAPPRDQLRVELGPEGARIVQAQWQRELAASGVRVLRGGIGVFEPAPQPPEGVGAVANLRTLDLDAWERVLEEIGAGGALDTPRTSAAPSRADAVTAAGAYLPTTLALRAADFKTSGRTLTQLVAGVSRGSGKEGSVWRVNLDAAELSGYGEYRPGGARSADAAGRVYARLSRLTLPEGEDDAVSALLQAAAPSSVPALDIVIDDFVLRGKRLGRLEIEAQNREPPVGQAGASNEWRLSKFRLDMPEAQLNAVGQWLPDTAAGPRRRASIDFTLEVADAGALLARLGQSGVLRGAKGRLAGKLNWLGSPLEIDYPSLGGEVNVAFEGGQFLKADPGIAKLLGVLSLQALPRRLLLDFRDVFQQGFAFDSITGDASIARGVASTRNLRMRGVQAVVLMEGSADLAQETQDLQLWVVPEINAGTASLAFAVINPALGIGSFVAQWLLRSTIGEAGTRQFHVFGPWADPKVERVERKLQDPVPEALAEPSSAPLPAATFQEPPP